jgi:AcrR family transcriptional regulator
MKNRERRERERAQRHRLIVATARRLAETEGWDAVTIRRLADEIEYSQPVLYSHFANKNAIVGAIAVDGFAELAEALMTARDRADGAEDEITAILTAYVDFAEAKPAVYDAMFARSVDLPFAQADTPAPLHAAFNALRGALHPLTRDRDTAQFTEVVWSALHGLVTLTRDGRIPTTGRSERVVLLADLLLTPAPDKTA